MPADPLDLWPDAIEVAPLTPLRILQLQVEGLRKRTQGRLVAEVLPARNGSPVRTPDEWGPVVVHQFELVAKALGYRHQLVVCVHQKEFAYPVLIVADGLNEDGVLVSSQDEFLRTMKELLNAKPTRALIESLLARIAESTPEPVSA